MRTKRVKSVRTPSAKSDDQPATRKMLSLVRKELIQKMDSGFNRVDAKFAGMEAKFESRFSGLEASNSRMEFLLEEQRSNNRIVLEGLQALWQRQDRLEAQQKVQL